MIEPSNNGEGNGELPESVPNILDTEHRQLTGEPRHLRRDARLIAKMLAIGSITPQAAESLLAAGAGMAADAARRGDTRAYKRCMEILLSAAKAELATVMYLEPNERQPAGGVTVNVNGGDVQLWENASVEELEEIQRLQRQIAQRTAKTPQNGHSGNGHSGNGKSTGPAA